MPIDYDQIVLRDTYAALYADNDTLASGQVAITSDNKIMRVGPGAFRSLSNYRHDAQEWERAEDLYFAQQRDTGGGGGGATAWGDISGSIGDQGDLTSVLAGIDDTKQDRLRTIATINDENIYLLATHDVIIAEGADNTGVIDPGDLDIGVRVYMKNESTANMTFTPDTGSAVVIAPGGCAMFQHKGAGLWTDLLAGKADTANVPKVYFATILGDGSVDGTPYNTIGGTPVVIQVNPGTYQITITGALTANKTFIDVIQKTGDPRGHMATISGEDDVQFLFFNAAGYPADPGAFLARISVYP